MKHRLVLIDDHPIVREGLKTFLGLQDDLSIVAEAGSLKEGLELVAESEPDLILLDVQLPDGNALKALESFKQRAPKAKLLILTSVLDDFGVKEAMQLGASGYVLKHSGPKALVDYIRAVLRGELALDPSALKALANQPTNPIAQLTPREKDVFLAIAKGLSNKQIATELDIAEKTVKTHATSVFSKLNVKDRVQVVLLAKKLGL